MPGPSGNSFLEIEKWLEMGVEIDHFNFYTRLKKLRIVQINLRSK